MPRYSLLLLLAASLVGCGDLDPREETTDAMLTDTALDMDAGSTDGASADAGPTDAADTVSDTVVDDAGGDEDADTSDEAASALYPAGRTLSPLTTSVAQNIRTIAEQGATMSDDVFAKIGASNTVNRNHLHCFAGPNVHLDGRTELSTTVDHFGAGDAAGTSPYERESLAATVGWSALKALEGDPMPLEQEVSALSPRYGLVHFGTNDIQLRNIYQYADNLLDIADWLIARGVLPVLTSLPPRDDDASADAWVPRYNAAMRAVAQARQVPFIDLHRELVDLPDHGIGSDGIHLNVYRPSGARGCDFSQEGLEHGHNMRNLLTIQTLDRMRRVLDGEDAPDATAPHLTGEGTTSAPFRVDAFPFSDVRDTSAGGQRLYDRYDGCNADQDESGAEFVYRVELDSPATLRAFVFDRGDVDIDLHLLDGTAAPAGCIERDHKTITATLDAGVHYFVLDTFVSGGDEKAGEFIFVLLEE